MTHREASDAIMLAVAEMLPAESRGVFADLDSLRERLGDLREHWTPPPPVPAGTSPPSGEKA